MGHSHTPPPSFNNVTSYPCVVVYCCYIVVNYGLISGARQHKKKSEHRQTVRRLELITERQHSQSDDANAVFRFATTCSGMIIKQWAVCHLKPRPDDDERATSLSSLAENVQKTVVCVCWYRAWNKEHDVWIIQEFGALSKFACWSTLLFWKYML